ncbi:ectoine utilization protein EutC [Salinisphaera sp. PC39]|uniref:cyclodeaminase n=1 Tax=Salinisphaera sp. PC39 TaxID=1304156 RepID=UPI00334215C8
MTRIVTEKELTGHVAADADGLDAVADGFARLGRGEVTLPPILGLEIPDANGAADAKAAYVRGWDRFAIKVSTRFFDNPRIGLPSAGGMMAVLDAGTGRVEAVLLDNGYLTTVRTALAGALAARHLAPERVATVGVLGAGGQARWQLRALRLVRDFRRVFVYGRDPERAKACAREMAGELDRDVTAAESAEAAVRGADVVVTTTPATAPLVRAEWLGPGQHITAMGSDAGHKNELDPAALAAADVLVCDAVAQCRERGELRHALAGGTLPDTDNVRELGAIVAGAVPGRENQDQLTVADLTGVGVQDTAIARLALDRAEARGLGTVLD